MPVGPELTAHNLQPRHLRDRKLLGYLLHRSELDAADDAVPVRLGVVRIEVRALDHLHRHAPAIVHAEGERMHARLQLAQAVELRRGHVIAGVHQGAVQVQFRGLGALQVQRQLLVPPHIRRYYLLPVPGLAHERMPARQPPGFHGQAILRIRRRHPLPSQVRRPGQDDAGIDRQHGTGCCRGRGLQIQPPLPSDLQLRRTGHGGQHGHGHGRDQGPYHGRKHSPCDRKTLFHIAKLVFFSERNAPYTGTAAEMGTVDGSNSNGRLSISLLHTKTSGRSGRGPSCERP